MWWCGVVRVKLGLEEAGRWPNFLHPNMSRLQAGGPGFQGAFWCIVVHYGALWCTLVLWWWRGWKDDPVVEEEAPYNL